MNATKMNKEEMTRFALRKATEIAGNRQKLAELLDWPRPSINYSASTGTCPPWIALKLARLVDEMDPSITHPKVYSRVMVEAQRAVWQRK